MAGKKTTLKMLCEEFESFKDKHKKEISDLKKTIKKQETQIKMLEKCTSTDRHVDIPKKVKDNDDVVLLNVKNLANEKTNQLNCNKCNDKFSKFSDLELHIKEKHGNYEEQECDKCEKKFVTAWRLRKHRRIHFQKFTKMCNYFRMKTNCPFEELGCKFSHDAYKKDTVTEKVNKNVDKTGDTDNSSMSLETDGETSSFHTSTPKSDKRCEECENISQCVDCFVIQTLGGHGKRRKLFY